ncbi:MAG: GNAT family N-acetyltransferase [Bacteroidia bacterium]
MECTYRKTNITDLKAVQELTLMAYGQYKDILSKENWEKWETNFNDDNTFKDLFEIATCFVCQFNNEIIGTAFLVMHGNPHKLFQTDWAYIRFVGVNSNFEGQGIGRKLTQICIDQAKETGEKIIALHTSEFQNAARHIYESLGFVKQREFESFGKKYWVFTLDLK